MKTRFGIKLLNGEKGSTTGHVVWASNHLNQRRQFAFDGRFWFYQPSTKELFIKVDGNIPKNAVDIMAAASGLSAEALTQAHVDRYA